MWNRNFTVLLRWFAYLRKALCKAGHWKYIDFFQRFLLPLSLQVLKLTPFSVWHCQQYQLLLTMLTKNTYIFILCKSRTCWRSCRVLDLRIQVRLSMVVPPYFFFHVGKMRWKLLILLLLIMSNQLKCFIQDAELILEPTEDWWWFFFCFVFNSENTLLLSTDSRKRS